MLSCERNDGSNEQNKAFDVHVFEDESLNTDYLTSSFDVVSIDDLDEGTTDFISGVYKIQYFDGKIFILDRWDGKKISVYAEQDGAFLFNIGQSGDSPDSYSFPYDFYLDKKNGVCKVLTAGAILNFDLSDGSFLERESLNLAAVRFSKLNNGNWIFTLGVGEAHEVSLTDSKYQVINQFLPRIKMHSLLPWESIIEVPAEDPIYMRNYDNTIYRISENNELAPSIKISFVGQKEIPLTEKEEITKPSEVLTEFQDKKLLRKSFFKLSEYIVFVYVEGKNYTVVVKNLKTDEVRFFDGLKTDKNNITLETTFPSMIGIDDKENLIAITRRNLKLDSDGKVYEDLNEDTNESLKLIRFRPAF